MSSIADTAVVIQSSAQAVPSTPSWFAEVSLIAHYLKRLGVLSAIAERVRFARRRLGHYDLIDFVAVLLGYAISGEPTLKTFYERLLPFATPFMALFERDRLPARSTLSRFLAALDQASVEALRSLFLEDLLARPLTKQQPGGVFDRCGGQWLVFDVDGTRQAARQRALPQTSDRPAPQRRLLGVCAPGYRGRKRGEIVRTRTTVLQAHTHQWLLISGIRTIPTYHLICGFDARSFAVFKDSEGQFHISGHHRLGGQRRLSRGTAPRPFDDPELSEGAGPPTINGPHPSRWPIWQWGGH